VNRSTEIFERLRRYEGGGLRSFVEDSPLVWTRAQGSHVEAADGRRYLDLYGGFAVAAIGHGHPKVVEAVRYQAGELMHCPSSHPSKVRVEFYEALASIAPAGLDRFLPAVTGAMANEMAILIARAHKPGSAIVSFAGSYFGRSVGTVGFAGKARYREALHITPAGPFVPYPYPLRLGAKATDIAMEALEGLVADGQRDIAAVILEPVQGNGGVVIPPPDFLSRLRQFCDRNRALLIVDEIQSGCGRTGRNWAIEHSGVTPDLMTVGKGIGGGLAAAAVFGTSASMIWSADSYTSTFLTNNLNLAAAVAAIGVLQDDQLAGRAAAIGPPALERLKRGLGGIEGVREIRGLGLWYGIELTDAQWAARAAQTARERGVLVGRGGYEDNVVKLSPPLNILEPDLNSGIDAVIAAIGEAREAKA
jgi:4-aminobutyrate aminotransferase-like enzyme